MKKFLAWQKGGALAAALVVCANLSCGRGEYPANYREYAYVANTGSGTVSVIDVLALRTIKQLQVGAEPTGIAVNPTRNEVYVVNAGSGTVSVIDAVRNEVQATIPVGKSPYSIDVSEDGKTAAVANSGSDSVTILDLDRRQAGRTIAVGKAPGVARIVLNRVFVTERNSDSVSVLDLKTGSFLASRVSSCAQPTDIAVMPDASKVFVACSGSSQVAVLSQSSTKSATYALVSVLPVGRITTSLALKPDSGELFATNFGSDTVSEILTGDASVNATYDIGAKPSRALVSDDNSLLYVSNFGSNNVAVFSIDNGHLFAAVNVGSRPDAIALSRNQNFLFVADSASSDVAVVRTRAARGEKPSLMALLPVGAKPGAIAIKAFLQR